ncbi:FliH/SctL family protein [Caloranaerobacter ferrireducens]|uniref:FliH/SctL family protein n=1 Tax=Caloranaerobacter ferrireducens TaxID=1323370 RepID=UPI00084DF91B|nr:FliH/SctL family protein [Caloranaerobacter ferrireducens]
MSNVIKSYQVIVETSITNDNVKTDSKDNIEKIIKDAWEKHDEIINKAKIEAETILNEARENADIIMERMYQKSRLIIEESKQKGYEEGYKKGYEEGCIEAEKIIKEANSVKREYLQEKALCLKQLEKDIIELVINISEKIINQKLDDDKEVIISIILKGLESLLVSDKVIIRISKDDYDIVELAKERLLAEASLVEDIEVKIDNSLEKGGCVIETERGCVDVSIKTQIEAMKKTLKDILNSE